jgi:disulfide bond formation protein DsbB
VTARQIALFAGLASAAMLLGAWGFQYIGGMAPCKMCIWQRWPHGIAFSIGLVAWAWLPNRWLMLLGAAVVLTGAGIGVYHAGVEQHWWLGPDTCTSGDIGSMSTDALMDRILTAPLVRCDEIPWSMFGISMAGWNAIASLGFTGLWLLAFRRA